LLCRVRKTAIEAYTHQDLPFERVVRIAHPDRDTSRTPLFQVMFALQNAPQSPLRAPDLSLSPLALGSETSKFDLTLFAADVAEGLRLTMEYSTDLFDAATVDRMLAHYGLLLEAIAADPERRIVDLPWMMVSEQEELIGQSTRSQGESHLDELDLDQLTEDELDTLIGRLR